MGQSLCVREQVSVKTIRRRHLKLVELENAEQNLKVCQKCSTYFLGEIGICQFYIFCKEGICQVRKCNLRKPENVFFRLEDSKDALI